MRGPSWPDLTKATHHLQNVFLWLWQNYPHDCDKMDDSDIVLGQNEIAVAHCQVNSHVWLFKTFMEGLPSASPQVCSSVLKLTVTSKNGSEFIKEIRGRGIEGVGFGVNNSILGSSLLGQDLWRCSQILLSQLRRKKMNEALDSGGYEISKTMARDSYPKYIWWDGRHIRTDACI